MQQFEYLRKVAQKYGVFYGVHEFNACADAITEDALNELRGVYAVICEGDNRQQIQNWVGECFDRRGKISKNEFDFAMQVGQLFVFFDYLVRRGIQPFCDTETAYAPPVIRPNWENLPKELNYLIDVAESLGGHQSDTDALDFLDQILPQDMEILARAAERIRVNGHSEIIHRWLMRGDLGAEADMIGWLTATMMQAGLALA